MFVFSDVGSTGLKLGHLNCSVAFSSIGFGVVSVIFVISAFSKKWLYFAITVIVSTYGFPAWG